MPAPATFFAFDVETSGLDAQKHEILSIAMMLTDTEFNEIDRRVIYALPDHIEVAEPEALEINHYDPNLWAERGAVSQQALFKGICEFTGKYRRLRQIAHNHRFDEAFLKALYVRHQALVRPRLYQDTYSFHALDTIALGIFTDVALQGKVRASYGLNNLAECYGIVNASAHSAMDDVDCMVTTLRAMVKSIREAANIKPPVIETTSGIIKALDVDNDVWVFARGKHAGKLTSHVLSDDRQYIGYVLGFDDLSVQQRTHLTKLASSK